MKKKQISLLLILALFCSSLNVKAQTAINNWTDLAGMSATGNYFLAADLPAAGAPASWTPITNFSGTLDGRGRTIYGLTITGSSGGLFGTLSGHVFNIKFDNVNISSSSSWYVGVVAGTLSSTGKIEDVQVLSGDVTGFQQVGGIVGTVNSGTTLMGTLTNKATVTATYTTSYNPSNREAFAGGIAGVMKGTVANGAVLTNTGTVTGNGCTGGIFGEYSGTAITFYGTSSAAASKAQISNTALVQRQNPKCFADYTGGVIGKLNSAGTIIENYINTVRVFGEGSSEYNNNPYYYHRGIGGIVGGLLDGTVRDCTNNGDISGTSYVAGIVGIMGDLSNLTMFSTNHHLQNFNADMSIRNGILSGTLINNGVISVEGMCGGSYLGGITGRARSGSKINTTLMKNTGNILTLGWGSFVGGIIGGVEDMNLDHNCINDAASVTGFKNVGGLTGHIKNGTIDLDKAKTNSIVTGTIAGRFVGWMEGNAFLKTVEDYVVNDLPVLGSSTVGGIVGLLNTSDNPFQCPSKGAKNYGDITVEGSCIGGIIGQIDMLSPNAVAFEYAENFGNIVSNHPNIGGIVGQVKQGVIKGTMTNHASVKTAYPSTYSYYTIVNSREAWIGGIAGSVLQTGAVANGSILTNKGTVTGNGSTGGIFGEYKGNPVTFYGTSSTAINKAKIINEGTVECYSKKLFLDYMGGVIGKLNSAGTVIENYTNTIHISGGGEYNLSGGIPTNPYYYHRGIGGIVGGLLDGTIRDCTNEGNVTGTSYVAGIVGIMGNLSDLTQFTPNHHLQNFTTDMTVKNGILAGTLINNGTISHPGNPHSQGSYFGGITGRAVNGNQINATLLKNTGDILDGMSYVGGIIGDMNGIDLDCNALNDANVVKGGSYVGGLVGHIKDGMIDLDKAKTYSIVTARNYGSAFLVGNMEYSIGGGGRFVGWMEGNASLKTVQDTIINDLPVFGGSAVGGIVGYLTTTGNPFVCTSGIVKNYGTITATTDALNDYGDYVGGVVGLIDLQSPTDIAFNGAENYGTIINKGRHTGGIVGQVKKGLLAGTMINHGTVGSTHPDGWADYIFTRREAFAGGIAGSVLEEAGIANGSVLTNTATGIISANGSTGGIFGEYKGTPITFYGASSLAANKAKISNTALVKYNGVNECLDYQGGLIGKLNSVGTVIENYTNTAKVLGLGGRNSTSSYYHRGVGGIVGGLLEGTIRNCTNEGNISGTSYVAGIVGVMGNLSNYSAGANPPQNFDTDMTTGNGILEGELINKGVIAHYSVTPEAGSPTYFSSGRYYGGITSRLRTNSQINATFMENTGNILGTLHGSYAGGIIGAISDGNHTIKNSVNSAASVGGANYIGGLVGHLASGQLQKSYNKAALFLLNSASSKGGIVGWMTGGTISDVYNLGSVTTNMGGDSEVGGLIGRMDGGTITCAYNAGRVSGGLSKGAIGFYQAGTVGASVYFDTTTSGHSATNGGHINTEGKKTREMTALTGFWRDNVTWGPVIVDKSTYPYLKWQTVRPGISNDIEFTSISPKADKTSSTSNPNASIVLPATDFAFRTFNVYANPATDYYKPLATGTNSLATTGITASTTLVSIGVMSESDIVAFDTSIPNVTYKSGSGGTGADKTESGGDGYVVKDNTFTGFTPPTDQELLYWQGDDGKTYTPGQIIDVEEDLILTAVWGFKKIGVNLTVFQQGPTQTSGTMSNYLQEPDMTYTNSFLFGPVLPPNNPYGVSNATYANVNKPATGTAGKVVDWVKVEIWKVNINKAGRIFTKTVVEERALLLKPNGAVVDTLGAIPKFKVQDGTVHIVIKHRNHLAIMSNPITNFDGSSATVPYNFSDALNKAFVMYEEYDTPAMILKNGKWCMWAGDLDELGLVNEGDLNQVKFDAAAMRYNAYILTDVNLNGMTEDEDTNMVKYNFERLLYSITKYFP